MTDLEQTCALDGRAHLVTDDVYATALADGAGRFAALCGHVVEVASLATPPGPPCLACRAERQGFGSRAAKAHGTAATLANRLYPIIAR